MLKNGQAYFKNTAVETSQEFKSIFGHFSTLYMKVLNYYFFLGGGGEFKLLFERKDRCAFRQDLNLTIRDRIIRL